MAKKEDVLKKLEALNGYERISTLLATEEDKVLEGEHVDQDKDQIDQLKLQLLKSNS